MTRKPLSVPRTSFILAAVLTLGMALTAIPRGLAQPPLPGTFTSIDFPGASFTAGQGITPRGDIVGQYISVRVSHGIATRGYPLASGKAPAREINRSEDRKSTRLN